MFETSAHKRVWCFRECIRRSAANDQQGNSVVEVKPVTGPMLSINAQRNSVVLDAYICWDLYLCKLKVRAQLSKNSTHSCFGQAKMAEEDQLDDAEVDALPKDRQGRETAAALDKITDSVCDLKVLVLPSLSLHVCA